MGETTTSLQCASDVLRELEILIPSGLWIPGTPHPLSICDNVLLICQHFQSVLRERKSLGSMCVNKNRALFPDTIRKCPCPIRTGRETFKGVLVSSFLVSIIKHTPLRSSAGSVFYKWVQLLPSHPTCTPCSPQDCTAPSTPKAEHYRGLEPAIPTRLGLL